MKKILILIVFLLLFSSQKYDFIFAQNDLSYYAKVENEGYFYSSINDKNPLFQIPTSYFVLLTGEENDSFYQASYKGIKGVVKKEDVTPMSGTPSTPYPIAKFRVFAREGLELLSQPSYQSKLLTTIPFLYSDIEFFGYITGEENIPEKSNQWIYCKYQSNLGYLYSVFCDGLNKIEKNTETFATITPDFSLQNISNLSNSSVLWIVLGVGIPSVVVLFLLLKPSLLKEHMLNGKVKSKRKKDYYEFDDASLN